MARWRLAAEVVGLTPAIVAMREGKRERKKIDKEGRESEMEEKSPGKDGKGGSLCSGTSGQCTHVGLCRFSPSLT